MFVRTPRTTEVRLGPFRLLERIGRGGMGQVWRAVHEAARVEVAVKTVTIGDALSTDAFHREVRAVAGLDHPGIVWVFDAGTVDDTAEAASGRLLLSGSPYLVMELVPGGTLDRGRVHPWQDVQLMLVDVLEALAHAHAHGVIHRDLKPANLLRTGSRPGRPGAYKLADFGIAHALGSGRADAQPAGTIQYTAPEQLAGRWYDLGPWTDLYSLGCITWLLLTGAPLFGPTAGEALVAAHASQPPPSFHPKTEVPPGVEAWLRVLLEKEPHQRFATAAQAMEALRTLDPATVARTPRRVPPEWRDPTPALRPMALIGAGLGLYGLRPFHTVGREHERDALWRHLRAAAFTHRPRAVQLLGPPGVGRTHLGEWLCGRAAEVGAAEALALPPGERWRPALERWLGVSGLRGQPRATQIERALARSGRPDPDLCEWVVAALGAEDHPEVRRTTVRRIVSHTARRGPVVVWLDDADQDGVQLATEIVERGTGPVLVVLAPPAAVPGFERLELGALPPGPHARLVRDLLRLDETLAARVELHTGGSPRFAVELVRGWVARGWLTSTPTGFALAGSVRADPTLPSTIDRVWADRIDPLLDGLGPAGRDALELAACLGREVREAPWRAAAGDPATCDVLLERMLRTGLVTRDELEWRFVEPEFRDAVSDGARRAGRWSSCHARIAAVLPAGDPRVGSHLLAAGRPTDALPLLFAAIRRHPTTNPGTLARLAECDAALDQLGVHREDDPQRGWVHAQRALVLNSTGATLEAERLLERLEPLARRRGWSEVIQVVLRVRASLALNRRDVAAGERSVVEILSIAADPNAEIDAWYLRSIFARLRGDLEDSASYAAEGLRVAEAAGDLRAQVNGWKLHGLNAHRAGDMDGIERWLGRALEYFRSVADAYSQGDCLNSLARVPLARGDRAAGERLLTQAVAAFEAAGSVQAAYPMLNLGFSCLTHHEVREGREWLMRARDRVTRARRTALLALAECGLAVCAADGRDWDAFDEHVAAANRALDDGTTVSEGEMRELLERAARQADDAVQPARAAAARALADRVSPREN